MVPHGILGIVRIPKHPKTHLHCLQIPPLLGTNSFPHMLGNKTLTQFRRCPSQLLRREIEERRERSTIWQACGWFPQIIKEKDVHMPPKQCNVDLVNIGAASTQDPQLQLAFVC